MTGRVWLDVPFRDKDTAKNEGARWDPAARRWWCAPGAAAATRWPARPPLPDLLPGEDRAFGQGLFVDLIPKSCWAINARTMIDGADWDRVRRMVTGRADHTCEVCHTHTATGRTLDVHERWDYALVVPGILGTQTLRRLIALCPDCHEATHMGYAMTHGRLQQAGGHLATITGMTHDQASRHIEEAFRVWNHRNQIRWTLNLDILTTASITLARQPDHGHIRPTARARDGFPR
jgi:hypothetical protein